jgi:hypothetical protein
MECLQGLQVGKLKRIWVFRVWVHLRPMGVEINLKNKTRGVSHCGLAIYITKYLKAKEEELWKLKYFIMQKKI